MIYATLVPRQPGKYNSERRQALIAAALAVFGAAYVCLEAAPIWREAPEFLAIFAPAAPRSAAYRMRVADADVESVLRQLEDDPTLLRIPGAWEVRDLAPADAFGNAGGYDRLKLARLYGAARARVARGARLESGRVVESWSLISPYPDPALETLRAGTLLIVLRLP